MDPAVRAREIVDRGLQTIVQYLRPRRIFLFGSRGRGSASVGSDFDFAVEGTEVDADQERYVRELLQTIAGLHSVDLIFLERVDPAFRILVLDEGQLLYDQEHGGVRDCTV